MTVIQKEGQITLGLCAREYEGFSRRTQRFLTPRTFPNDDSKVPVLTENWDIPRGEAESRCSHRLGNKETPRPAVYSQRPKEGPKAARPVPPAVSRHLSEAEGAQGPIAAVRRLLVQ